MNVNVPSAKGANQCPRVVDEMDYLSERYGRETQQQRGNRHTHLPSPNLPNTSRSQETRLIVDELTRQNEAVVREICGECLAD